MAVLRWLLVLMSLAHLLSCSSGNDNVPEFDAVVGRHPDNWIERHWMEYTENPEECRQCHGGELRGGISQLSCFTPGVQACHPNGPAGHPFDWNRPDLHGAAAKGVPGGSMSGFSSCQRCHGEDFSGGSANVGASAPVSCLSCHTRAPHPDAPWRGSIDANITHTTTDEGNAPVCALCHLGNLRLSVPVPVPANANPGCFNNTMCHGESGHPPGWSNYSTHGKAAKDLPSAIRGFAACKDCHGLNFEGAGAAVSCFSAQVGTTGCHNVSAPHPGGGWLAAEPAPTHTNTNTQNAVVCGECHLSGANSARKPSPPAPAGTPVSCFNNTLCHAAAGSPHAVPFTSPALHGPPARQNFIFCQGCHAGQGGAGTNPRFNVAIGGLLTGCEASGCHKINTAHPEPTQGFTFWLGHRNAGNMQNACALCHGAALQGGIGRACSSCHTAGSPLTVLNCFSCHGNPPPPPAEANFTHREHNTIAPNLTGQCATCHTNAGSGTPNHFNGVKNVSISLTFNAKTGTASYNPTATTCSNVSCHGGQTTPAWKTGFINVNAECNRCHQSGTAQFNGFFSGEHRKHVVEENIACTSCHDTARLAGTHFTGLNTPGFTNPRGTIGAAVRYVGSTCDPRAGGITGCHGQETWQ